LLADAAQSKQGSLDLNLNGKQPTFTLTKETTKSLTLSKTSLAFGVSVVNGTNRLEFGLDRTDQVTLTVTKMDNLSLEANFSGTLSQLAGPEHIKVSGVISLHRASAPADVSAGNYVDCDPVIHDWLNQAENRAPSDCEVKFDRVARSAFATAFAPMTRAFMAEGWRVTKTLEPAELTAMPRKSENGPYHFGFAQGADVVVQVDMDPGAPEFQRLKAASEAPDPAMTKVMELMKQGRYAEAKTLSDQGTVGAGNAYGAFRDNTQILVRPDLNFGEFSVVNFHGAYAATPLAGGGTVLFLPEAQPPTGGSAGEPATWVLLGSWGPVSAASLGDGGTKVTAKATASSSVSRLTAQAITVRFRCSREAAQKAIATVDWGALRALISRRP